MTSNSQWREWEINYRIQAEQDYPRPIKALGLASLSDVSFSNGRRKPKLEFPKESMDSLAKAHARGRRWQALRNMARNAAGL